MLLENDNRTTAEILRDWGFGSNKSNSTQTKELIENTKKDFDSLGI